MDTYRTEEEQVEALRKWWDDNGRSTLLAVVLAVGLGFGWQGWQQHQQQQAELASLRYEELLEAVQVVSDEAGVATVRHLAETLKTEFPDSAYARFAALHLARLAVMNDDLDSAERELRWVLTTNTAAEINALVELRLARVVAAQGDLPAALQILAAAQAGAYAPAYAEVQGDIYQQQGDNELALEAYQRAIELAAASGTGASESLQLKAQVLSPLPARRVSVAVVPADGTEPAAGTPAAAALPESGE